MILLDEVDHLSGGLREISSERISSIVSGEDIDNSKALRGDSGGKAELLNLLSETRQPVILACNDEMGLWVGLHLLGVARDCLQNIWFL